MPPGGQQTQQPGGTNTGAPPNPYEGAVEELEKIEKEIGNLRAAVEDARNDYEANVNLPVTLSKAEQAQRKLSSLKNKRISSVLSSAIKDKAEKNDIESQKGRHSAEVNYLDAEAIKLIKEIKDKIAESALQNSFNLLKTNKSTTRTNYDSGPRDATSTVVFINELKKVSNIISGQRAQANSLSNIMLKQDIEVEFMEVQEWIKEAVDKKKELEEKAKENTPDKQADRLRTNLDKVSVDSISLHEDLYKIINDPAGKGKLDDTQKVIYKAKLQNLQNAFDRDYKKIPTTPSATPTALDQLKIEIDAHNMSDLFTKITALIDSDRDQTKSVEKKMEDIGESATKIDLLIGNIDAEVEKKIEEHGHLTDAQKKNYYNQLRAQAASIRKLNVKINGVGPRPLSAEDSIFADNAKSRLDSLIDRLEEVDKSLDKTKPVDVAKVIKEADAAVARANDSQDSADKTMITYRDATEARDVSLREAWKMRRAGMSRDEIQEEQRKRLKNPAPSLSRAEKRQAMNDYKRAFRELKYAEGKLKDTLWADNFYDLPEDQQIEIKKKLIDVKDQRRKINKSVGVVFGDSMSVMDRASLQVERLFDWDKVFRGYAPVTIPPASNFRGTGQSLRQIATP